MCSDLFPIEQEHYSSGFQTAPTVCSFNIVQFHKISIPTPRKVSRNSKQEGGGSQKPKFLEESMKLNLNFQEVGV